MKLASLFSSGLFVVLIGYPCVGSINRDKKTEKINKYLRYIRASTCYEKDKPFFFFKNLVYRESHLMSIKNLNLYVSRFYK